MSFLQELPKPFFVLAPMDDVTDTVFRQIVAALPYPPHLDEALGDGEKRTEPYMKYGEGVSETEPRRFAKNSSSVDSSAGEQAAEVRGYGAPDLYFTEFVNVDGLQSPGRERLLPKLRFSESEHPVIAQIWGKNPDNFFKTVQELMEMGFDGVDLNFGCPDKNVTRNGACSAFILPANRPLAMEIIQACKEGIEAGKSSIQKNKALPFPLSVKTRLGYGEIDLTWHEALLSQSLNMLTVHGRTKKEMSKVPARWDQIGRVRELRDSLSPDTLIIGNGDVLTRQQGEELAKTHKLDGIMIGRGIFQDPYVFAPTSPWPTLSIEERKALYRRHIELFAATWQNGERRIPTLNKFCKIYINGFDGAKEMRESLMNATSTDELLRLLAS